MKGQRASCPLSPPSCAQELAKYETLVKADAHELGLTLEQIRAWEPPAKSKGKQPRKARTKATKSEAREDNHE